MVKSYLCIESQSPYEAASGPHFFALACDLAKQGHKVEILLVQNGVAAAREGAKSPSLFVAIQAGIAVWADDFSMRERALAPGNLMRGVRPVAIGAVIDRMADGWNVIWH
jgi:hypothetical protein